MGAFDDLEARAGAAKGMIGAGGPGGMGMPGAEPELPPDVMGEAEDETAIQSALDGIDQAADTFGPEVGEEIRSHVQAIRELVSQGEAGQVEEDAPEEPMDAGAAAGQTPDTQVPMESGGGGGILP